MEAKCAVTSCSNPKGTRGWCPKHYQKWRLYGDPLEQHQSKTASKQCSVAGCIKTKSRQGLCQMHAWRLRVHGDHSYKYRTPTKCAVEQCFRVPKALGWCDLHYHRQRRTGILAAPIRILDRKRYRQVKLVGHPLANPKTGRIYLHRAMLFESIGFNRVPCFWCGAGVVFNRSKPPFIPDTLVVDHLDHDRHNNDRANLVPACNHCNCVRNRRNKAKLVSIYSARATMGLTVGS